MFVCALVIYQISMTGYLYSEISINHTHWTHSLQRKSIKILICAVLSPLAPVIIFCLHKYHYHPKLISLINWINIRQNKVDISHCNPPTWNILYEQPQNMNLYRWWRIQFYRHQPILIHVGVCCFTSIYVYIICASIYLRQPRYIISIDISFILITILRIIQGLIWAHAETIFVQSYWSRVAFTVFDILCISAFLWYLPVYGIGINDKWSVIMMILFCGINGAYFALLIGRFLAPTFDVSIKGCGMVCYVLVVWIYVTPTVGCACFSVIFLAGEWMSFQGRLGSFDETDFIFWSKMRYFIENASDKKDVIRRLCCINYELLNFYTPCKMHISGDCEYYQDQELVSQLREHRKYLFKTVNQYAQLRNNSMSLHPILHLLFPFWSQFKPWYDRHSNDFKQHSYFKYVLFRCFYCMVILSMIIGAFYPPSKVVQILSPLILCVYYWYIGSFDISSIEFLMILYVLCFIPVIIKFYKEMHNEWIFYHLMSGKKIPQITTNNKDLNMINIHLENIYSDYQQLQEVPLREKFLMEYFGDDVGSVIIDFIGRFYRDSNNIGRKVWAQNLNGVWVQARVVDEKATTCSRHADRQQLKLHVVAWEGNARDVWRCCGNSGLSFTKPK